MRRMFWQAGLIVVPAFGILSWLSIRRTGQSRTEIEAIHSPITFERGSAFSKDEIVSATADFWTAFSEEPRIDLVWAKRLSNPSRQSDRDILFQEFMLSSSISRAVKLGTLRHLLLTTDIENERLYLLDTLSALSPIELVDDLTKLFQESPSSDERLKLLEAIRSAGQITAEPLNTQGETGVKVASAFVKIQGLFLNVLDSKDVTDPAFKLAMLSIPATFPTDEATKIISEIQVVIQKAYDDGQETQIQEGDLLGVWMEVALGDSGFPRIESLANFFRANPTLEIENSIKVRALDLLNGANFTSSQLSEARIVIKSLKPTSGPDSAFVKWLDTSALIEGQESAYNEVLSNGSSIEIASIIHFGNREFLNPIIQKDRSLLTSRLFEASHVETDPEVKNFIGGALSLLREF